MKRRFNGIEEVVKHEAGSTRRAQVVACTHEGCSSVFEVTVNKDRRPPDVIFNMARRKGWTILESKGTYTCPNHEKEPKVATKEAETRAPSLEQRRAIFREIDESYVNKSYVEGVTDKTIGDKLRTPGAWVKTIREENFGPAGLDPAILAAHKALVGLQERVKRMEDEAVASFELATKATASLHNEIEALRSSLIRFAS